MPVVPPTTTAVRPVRSNETGINVVRPTAQYNTLVLSLSKDEPRDARGSTSSPRAVMHRSVERSTLVLRVQRFCTHARLELVEGRAARRSWFDKFTTSGDGSVC